MDKDAPDKEVAPAPAKHRLEFAAIAMALSGQGHGLVERSHREVSVPVVGISGQVVEVVIVELVALAAVAETPRLGIVRGRRSERLGKERLVRGMAERGHAATFGFARTYRSLMRRAFSANG